MIDLDALIAADPHAYGIHWYKNLASGCLERHFAEVKIEAEGGDDGGLGDADFGTHCHDWLGAYHTGQPLPPLSTTIPPKRYVSEAVLMSRYQARHSPTGLGKVTILGRRLKMLVELPDGSKEPFAGDLDCLVDVDAKAADDIYLERGIELAPGKYLGDWKTKARKPNNLNLAYQGDPQWTGYHQLYESEGNEPLAGTLVQVLYRYKEDDPEGFKTFVVPPPAELEILQWKGIIRDGARRLRELGPSWKDSARCFDYGRLCPRFELGCVRHNL